MHEFQSFLPRHGIEHAISVLLPKSLHLLYVHTLMAY